MIALILTGTIGAVLTYKAVRGYFSTRTVIKEVEAEHGEAWANAKPSHAWNIVAVGLGVLGLWAAFNLSFIMAGLLFLSATLSYAVGVGARLMRAKLAHFKSAIAS